MNPPSSSISGARAAAILAGAAAATLVAGVVALELVFGTWLSHNPWDRALALNIIVGRRMVFDASSLYPGGGSVVDTPSGLRGLRLTYRVVFAR